MTGRKDTSKKNGGASGSDSASGKQKFLDLLQIDLNKPMTPNLSGPGKVPLRDLANERTEEEWSDTADETPQLQCQEWLDNIAFIARCIACDLKGRKLTDALIAEHSASKGALSRALIELSDVFLAESQFQDACAQYLHSVMSAKVDTSRVSSLNDFRLPWAKNEFLQGITELLYPPTFQEFFPAPETLLSDLRQLATRMAERVLEHPVVKERLAQSAAGRAEMNRGQVLLQIVLSSGVMFHRAFLHAPMAEFYSDVTDPSQFSSIAGASAQLAGSLSLRWQALFITQLAARLEGVNVAQELCLAAEKARCAPFRFKVDEWPRCHEDILRMLARQSEVLDSLKEDLVPLLKLQHARAKMYEIVADDVGRFATEREGKGAVEVRLDGGCKLLRPSRAAPDLVEYAAVWSPGGEIGLVIRPRSGGTFEATTDCADRFLVSGTGAKLQVYSDDVRSVFAVEPEDSPLFVGSEWPHSDIRTLVSSLYQQLEADRALISQFIPNIFERLRELPEDALFSLDEEGVSIVFRASCFKEMIDFFSYEPILLERLRDQEALIPADEASEWRCSLKFPFKQVEVLDDEGNESLANERGGVVQTHCDDVRRECKKLLHEAQFSNSKFFEFLDAHWKFAVAPGKGSHEKVFHKSKPFPFGKDMRASNEPLNTTIAMKAFDSWDIPLDDVVAKLRKWLGRA